MKRFLIHMCLLTAFTSCSKSDVSVNANAISSPQWTHGTWGTEGADGTKNSEIRFTTNDVVLITGSSELSHKAQIKSYADITEVIVEETKSSEEYLLSISFNQGISTNYSFSKKDDNTLYWNNTGYGTLELTRQ